MVTSRAKFAFITAALVGCTVVSAPPDDEDVGSTSSALFTPFAADFDKPLTPSTRWGTFEEIVNGSPCYGSGIASVRRDTSHDVGTGSGSLAVTANYARSSKSNHVLAQKAVPTDSVDVALDYVAWAMIDPLAGDDKHEGETGPEMSIQRTKLFPDGWRTMTGGVQYIANKWSRQGEWQLWTDVGNGTVGWVPIRFNTKLTKGTWYRIALGVDYGARMYRSLTVTGPDVAFTMDLSTRPIVREVKFAEDALQLTLESENAFNNCGANGPFEYTVFYDDVSLTAPGAPPSTGKTCTGPSTQACGNCGTQSRTCTKGTWSAWGTCTNQGACAPLSTQACGNGGTQTCGPTCTWGVCTGEACTPRTCAELGVTCGTHSDGCGGTLDCGTCSGTCVPKTCADFGATCGLIVDGCGNLPTSCGSCIAPEICGGGGVHFQCGGGTASCTPKTCTELGANCGFVGDGCGNVISCGSCVFPNLCGGGGTPNVCGSGSTCTPRTCADAGATCGAIGDGCGNVLQCGTCDVPGDTCGGGGVANQCGHPTCTPLTCQQQGASCGWIGDGCGSVVSCGTCPFGMKCGAANQCVPSCTPRTCAQVGVTCGPLLDGCGATLDCGSCPTGQTCGGGGTAGQCGCTPRNCAQAVAMCGSTSDGCGGTLDCGTCPTGETCGAGGVPNQCGSTCTPTTCLELGMNCGSFMPDGCGGTLSCGTCPPGQTCMAWGVCDTPIIE